MTGFRLAAVLSLLSLPGQTRESRSRRALSHSAGRTHRLQPEKADQTLAKSFTSFLIHYWRAVVIRKGSQTFRWCVWWIFQLTNSHPTLSAERVCGYRGHVSIPTSFHLSLRTPFIYRLSQNKCLTPLTLTSRNSHRVLVIFSLDYSSS